MYFGSLTCKQYGPRPFADPESFVRGLGTGDGGRGPNPKFSQISGEHVLMYLY